MQLQSQFGSSDVGLVLLGAQSRRSVFRRRQSACWRRRFESEADRVVPRDRDKMNPPSQSTSSLAEAREQAGITVDVRDEAPS